MSAYSFRLDEIDAFARDVSNMALEYLSSGGDYRKINDWLRYDFVKPEDVINMWPDPSTSDELRIMEKWIDNKRYKLVRQLKQRVYNEIKNKLPK